MKRDDPNPLQRPTAPSGAEAALSGAPWPRTWESAEAAIGAVLVAYRDRALPEWLRQRPRFVRWAARRWLASVVGAGGDLLEADPLNAAAFGLLLEWGVHRLRPDNAAPGAAIDRAAWLQQPSWRPMLALACCFGFEPVPDFRDRYRRRPDEAVVDNLCGLWSVGPSTFYRYVAKGRQLLTTQLVILPSSGERRLALRGFVQSRLLQGEAFVDEAARADWHERQAGRAQGRRDAISVLAHLAAAGLWEQVGSAVKRFGIELARDPEAAALMDRWALVRLTAAQRVELLLARASLWRLENDEERERASYEQALQLAGAPLDDFLLGIVYGALGRFHESRDTDRAFACFEDSAELLRKASEQGDAPSGTQLMAEYLGALVKLAWLCVLRNDPRSRTLLDRADELRATTALPDDQVAMLEQTWGEYWRRAGQHQRALEHKHRALNIYQRLGNRQQVLATCSNLSILYAEVKDYVRAVAYGRRVVDHSEGVALDTYVLASAHVNLGAALFWLEDYGAAIAHYQQALVLSTAANLHVFRNRAHYNLAEAYYKRFQVLGDPADEQAGDFHVAEGQKADPSETDSFLREATGKLKSEMFAPNEGFALTRLIPEEHAAHPQEMAEIESHRKLLAVPGGADVHVRAHFAIAKAYLSIAVKERETALMVASRHGIEADFAPEVERLSATYGRSLTREQALAARWDEHAADLLAKPRRDALLGHLVQHRAIQKSAFAMLGELSPATASKYLNELAKRGLLEQTGKGPSTKYILPA